MAKILKLQIIDGAGRRCVALNMTRIAGGKPVAGAASITDEFEVDAGSVLSILRFAGLIEADQPETPARDGGV